MTNDTPAGPTDSDPLLQACVIPFRWRGDRLEICVITSLKNQKWIFPKGIVEDGDSVEQTAQQEALEEAGLLGRVFADCLGDYEDRKWGRRLLVRVFVMEVDQCKRRWLESDVRERRWVSPPQAFQLLSKPALRQFAESAVDEIKKGRSELR